MSIAVVEIPKKNPIPRSNEKAMKSFSFQVKPAIKLKQSLESLAEEHFNPKGFGMIEVGEIGMDITARNIDNSAASQLWLKATGLINFECKKPMINKMVNLNHILQNLVDLPDEDTVAIHHLDGFDELFFSYGTSPKKQFAVELLELDPSFEKFPNITFACEGIVLCDHLRVMIEEYQTPGKPKIVSVDMSKNEMNVFVGNKRWPYRYDHEKWNGIRGLAPQQKHHAWFQLPHCEFLKKASMLVPGFFLCFATDPRDHILMRFHLSELGDLIYLNKSVLTFLQSDEYKEIKVGLISHIASTVSLL